MAIKDDITLSKGALSVTLFTTRDTENSKNTLTVVPSVVAPDNQDTGAKVPIVVDLLRMTRTYQFECYIVDTTAVSAISTKNNLKSIFEGAGVVSTPIILTYEDKSINVFFEDLVIKGIKNDDAVASGYSGEDSAEYQVTLTLVEGRLVGS